MRTTDTRLIPARAGNTVLAAERMSRASAHPRSRGEHRPIIDRNAWLSGSSPLARGTRHVLSVTERLPRLIPARAGNTSWGVFLVAWVSAHPRSRGEHSSSRAWTRKLRGSSPLARGTLSSVEGDCDLHRLIPARAGNTLKSRLMFQLVAAHPRSRGEHTPVRSMMSIHPGSSPLARGTLTVPVPVKTAVRLIPARAGNTQARRWG